MVLEAIILCLDNSDWTRNGDYSPTRWSSQIEAANLIIENHCQSNPENGLGIISMAGKRVEVHSSLTNDESRLLNISNRIPISGECDIITALNIASKAISGRNALPILNGIKINIQESGLTLTASDNYISIVTKLPSKDSNGNINGTYTGCVVTKNPDYTAGAESAAREFVFLFKEGTNI